MRERDHKPLDRHEVEALVPLLRRVVEHRLQDPEDVDDIIQETLTRLMEVQDRLHRNVFASYAVATARNLTVSLRRQEELETRHAHRLLDPQQPDTPEEQALRREEQEAVKKALEQLTTQDQELLVDHQVAGEDTKRLARQLRSTPGSIATRLARARARLRVGYVLALRRVQLPTERCRPVLLELSAGDRRRQRALDAGGHLAKCLTCASLSEPLIRRRRPLEALLPLAGLRNVAGRIGRRLRTGQGQAVAATGAVVAGVVAVLLITSGLEPPASFLTVDGEPVFPLTRETTLSSYAEKRVVARKVPVQSVLTNEGFWIGPSAKDRVWVQLKVKEESAVSVQPGQKLNFTGTFVPNPPGFLKLVGLTHEEGAAKLRRQGYHVELAARALRRVG